jgi:transcriptional regulator with GAF, ATPase, and Fis domain
MKNKENTTIKKLSEENELLKKKVESLTKELLHTYEELNLAYEVAETFGTVLDLESVNNQILSKGLEITHSDMGWLVAKEKDKFLINTIEHIDKKQAQTIDDALGKKILNSSDTIVIKDLSEYVEFDVNSHKTPTTFISVPLKSKDNILGAVCMCRIPKDAIYTSNEAKLLKVLCDHASNYFQKALELDKIARQAMKDWVKQ